MIMIRMEYCKYKGKDVRKLGKDKPPAWYSINWPLTSGDRINPVQHDKYYGCWFISNYDNDYVE